MEKIVRGKCWKFPDNFPTDLITPKERLSDPFPEMAKHVFETVGQRSHDDQQSIQLAAFIIIVVGVLFRV